MVLTSVRRITEKQAIPQLEAMNVSKQATQMQYWDVSRPITWGFSLASHQEYKMKTKEGVLGGYMLSPLSLLALPGSMLAIYAQPTEPGLLGTSLEVCSPVPRRSSSASVIPVRLVVSAALWAAVYNSDTDMPSCLALDF